MRPPKVEACSMICKSWPRFDEGFMQEPEKDKDEVMI